MKPNEEKKGFQLLEKNTFTSPTVKQGQPIQGVQRNRTIGPVIGVEGAGPGLDDCVRGR